MGISATEAQTPAPDSFNPGTDAGSSTRVDALAVQSDGKVVLAGNFIGVAGQTRVGIARVDAEGVLDSTFNPAPINNCYVGSLLIQPDGQIVIGGQFTQMGGQARTNLARLNPDGTAEIGFNPVPDSSVGAIALQPDGKLVLGGWFTHMNGQPHTNLARLNPDGTLDNTFNPSADSFVGALMVQPDGKILVGGYFSQLEGQPRSRIGRLESDGSLDTGFDAGSSGASGYMYGFALQADTNILVCGDFSTLGGQPGAYIARLHPDGRIDPDFNPGRVYYGEYTPAFSMALQADGKIVVGGRFALIGGQFRQRIARLLPDGTADTTFDPGVSDQVTAVALQSDGKILTGGQFLQVGGQTRTNVGRFNNTDAATQALTLNGSSLVWSRSGTTPEVRRTTFDFSPDGTTWTNLGVGARIPGGWTLNGVSLPTAGFIRARGENCGSGQGSSWFVESYLNIAPNLRILTETLARPGPTSFSFTLTSPPSAALEVQASSNLTEWTSLAVLTNESGSIRFTDQTATASQRAYRARMLP
jgi:uncharacterized delta-60 repeat protein